MKAATFCLIRHKHEWNWVCFFFFNLPLGSSSTPVLTKLYFLLLNYRVKQVNLDKFAKWLAALTQWKMAALM